jgi:hypothetical protein
MVYLFNAKSIKNIKHNINVGTYLKFQSFDFNQYIKSIDEAPDI